MPPAFEAAYHQGKSSLAVNVKLSPEPREPRHFTTTIAVSFSKQWMLIRSTEARRRMRYAIYTMRLNFSYNGVVKWCHIDRVDRVVLKYIYRGE